MEKIITVVGTTASGKSDLGIYLAQKFNGEIVSCDSRQVFKGLDLGTGKVTPEEQKLAVHHLIDIIEPNEKFSSAQFQKLAYKSINDILERKKTPFLVGGTGLYSRAVVEGFPFEEEEYNPEIREEVNALTKEQMLAELAASGEIADEGLSPRHLARRVEKLRAGKKHTAENKPLYEYIQLVCVYPREILNARIEERLDKRLELGMVNEVRRLKECGATDEFLNGLGLEYRHTNAYLNGEKSFENYRDDLCLDIKHFAKRQKTWFKKEKNAIWLDMSGDYRKQAEEICAAYLNGESADGIIKKYSVKREDEKDGKTK